MKLEAGLYVRTKDGIIDEVIIDYKGHCNNPNCNRKCVSCRHNYYSENAIIKVSHNIIDLIEVGDYVNGMKVFEVIKNSQRDDIKEHLIVFVAEENNSLFSIYADEIKSIVTREQFDSMSYKVGD